MNENKLKNNTEESLRKAFDLFRHGKYKESKDLLKELIPLFPKNSELQGFYGVINLQLGDFQVAVDSFKKAISISPIQPEVLFNFAKALEKLNKLDDAISRYDEALKINPFYAKAYAARGSLLSNKKDYKNAFLDLSKAIDYDPSLFQAYWNRGICLLKLKNYNEAILDFEKVIQLKPDYYESFNGKGIALQELKRYEEALICFDHAIQLDPNDYRSYANKGNILLDLNRFEEALFCFEKAIYFEPDSNNFIYGSYLRTKSLICDWENFDLELDTLLNKIEKKERATVPFPILCLIDDPKIHKKAAEIFVETEYPLKDLLIRIRKNHAHQKIRLGYFSADFHLHATMLLMIELFELHDKEKFELYAFSFGPKTSDPFQSRVIAIFDTFIDVRFKSDIEVVEISRSLGIDIAIDLKGFTQDCRMGIFSNRAAPIQINFLGYPGTLAASYIDYLIADSILIDISNREYFSEKIIYLPNSYQVNSSKLCLSNKSFTKKELGIPEDNFVFCSFNSCYKITPTIFNSWMRILNRVKNSTLLILLENEKAKANLNKEAMTMGVESSRLVFVGKLPVEEHLRRIQIADLFLDTFPYNAHTTASDSLRMGVPILTRKGNSFVSRVAASLLSSLDLGELITSNQQEYESVAIELSTNNEKFMEIKNKLLNNLKTSSLFNSKLFTHHIESAYKEIYNRYLNGLLPEDLHISA